MAPSLALTGLSPLGRAALTASERPHYILLFTFSLSLSLPPASSPPCSHPPSLALHSSLLPSHSLSLSLSVPRSLQPDWLQTRRDGQASLSGRVTSQLSLPCRPADVLLPSSNHSAGLMTGVHSCCDRSICIGAFFCCGGAGEDGGGPDLEA